MVLHDDQVRTSTSQPLTDQELVKRAVAGCHDAFEILISRYSLRLFHFLRHRMSNQQDAEDVIQETFIKAFQNIHRYQPQWKFSTWLYTIASRLAISFYRSRRWKFSQLTQSHDSRSLTELADAAQSMSFPAENLHNLWTLARQLKPDQYDILWLFYAEELPVADIASVVNKSQIHVRVLLHRARLKLIRLTTPVSETANSSAKPSPQKASVY